MSCSTILRLCGTISAVGLLSLLAGGGPSAAQPPAQVARTPDFSGYWIYDRPSSTSTGVLEFGGRVVSKAVRVPPLTEAGRAMSAAARARGAAGTDYRTVNCLPPNNFDMMTWSDPIAILQRPDAVVIIPEKERALPRHIYIGGPAPANPPLSINGSSTGRWEGDTLVVETTALDPSTLLFLAGYVPHSADTRVDERMRLEEGGQGISVEWVITDPKVFTEPYRLTAKFKRAPAGTEAFEAVCDPNSRTLG